MLQIQAKYVQNETTTMNQHDLDKKPFLSLYRR